MLYSMFYVFFYLTVILLHRLESTCMSVSIQEFISVSRLDEEVSNDLRIFNPMEVLLRRLSYDYVSEYFKDFIRVAWLD